MGKKYKARNWQGLAFVLYCFGCYSVGKSAEVKAQFEEAWQHADVELTSSRF